MPVDHDGLARHETHRRLVSLRVDNRDVRVRALAEVPLAGQTQHPRGRQRQLRSHFKGCERSEFHQRHARLDSHVSRVTAAVRAHGVNDELARLILRGRQLERG